MLARWRSLTFLLCWCVGVSSLYAADEPEKSDKTEKAAPAKPEAAKEAVEATIAKPSVTEESKKPAPAKTQPAVEAASPSDTNKAAEPTPAELAIRRNAEEYVIAYEAQDAEKLAALWAPNAVWVNGKTGERVAGRDAIQVHFSSLFESSDPIKLKVQIQDIHFTTPAVAVEDGTATVIQEGEEPKITSYTAVHVLVDGKWLIDSIRETDLPPAPTASEQLSQLDWLVGTWVDESEDATVLTTYHWTPKQNFLVQSFSVLIGDNVDMQGTQIIGWDASQGKIRSWMFDSEGGFAEGNWDASEENRWVIRQASTLPDGRHGAAIHVLTKLDDDSFTWKSSGRQIEGILQPNIDEFTIVRQTTVGSPNTEDEALNTDQESLKTDQEESSDETQ